jgi:TPR repeat protein
MRGYRLAFTDRATQRQTGNYWRKEPAGNYLPMLMLDATGQVVQSNLTDADEAQRAGDDAAAYRILDQQYQQGNFEAGFRLADLLLKGRGTAADPARAFAIFSELAQAGEVVAEHNLGVCYEFGNGVTADYAQAEAWYRRAARHGSLPGLYSLGEMHASDRIRPRDDIEGLALLIEASARAMGDDPASRYILEHQPAQVKRLRARMSAGDIAQAKQRAAARAQAVRPAGQPE